MKIWSFYKKKIFYIRKEETSVNLSTETTQFQFFFEKLGFLRGTLNGALNSQQTKSETTLAHTSRKIFPLLCVIFFLKKDL